MSMKREIILVILGFALITAGVYSLISLHSSSLPISEAYSIEEAISNTKSPLWPAWVSVRNREITAEVAAGGYDDGKWILDGNYVLYLPTSGKLGQGGNTVLYAHNREKLFGNLKDVSIGDTVMLGDNEGNIYSYKVYSMEYIKPYEVEKINTDKSDTVTLFTCDGWFDETRLVVKAEITSS
jgi:LPXTG-site transpeptidase (sortase) family protein